MADIGGIIKFFSVLFSFVGHHYSKIRFYDYMVGHVFGKSKIEVINNKSLNIVATNHNNPNNQSNKPTTQNLVRILDTKAINNYDQNNNPQNDANEQNSSKAVIKELNQIKCLESKEYKFDYCSIISFYINCFRSRNVALMKRVETVFGEYLSIEQLFDNTEMMSVVNELLVQNFNIPEDQVRKRCRAKILTKIESE